MLHTLSSRRNIDWWWHSKNLKNTILLISGHGLLVWVPYVPRITTTSSTLYVGPALPGGFPDGAPGSYTGLLNENGEYWFVPRNNYHK